MIDTFDKHIDFCCFYQHKTVIRIFRITENRLFESDFDRFPELENIVGKKKATQSEPLLVPSLPSL